MGSSGSKGRRLSYPSSSYSFSAKVRRGRSKAFRGFQSSCFSSRSGSYYSDDDHREKENEGNGSVNQIQRDRVQMKFDGFGRVKVEKSSEMQYISSDIGEDECNQETLTNSYTRTGSPPAQASSTQSSNPSSRPRFSFIPGSLSFRLTRATSLGSSNPYPVCSSLPTPDNEDGHHLRAGRVRALINRDETREDNDLLLSSQLDGTQMSGNGGQTDDFGLNMRAFENADCLPYDETTSPACDRATNVGYIEVRAHDQGTCVDTPVRTGINAYTPIISNGSENAVSRLSDNQVVNSEPVERYCHFGRTLSVGRLRDRVIRRSSLSDSPSRPFQLEREERDRSQNSGTEVRNVDGRTLIPESGEATSSIASHCPSSLSNSLFSIRDYEVQSMQPRESRYYDLLEHSSNFLERRRRIRSQVRALQRLGSRFENVSGHERSCTLAGQHRSGLCTCPTNNRNANSNENASARASISRIVLLAEALFEVLDEIHQQSVVLSSRPSASSVGSTPAPNETVDSIPVKSYSELQKHHNEEVPLCYICLVEYEEGDEMRVLPCHHEFHKTCVDKWLKEIQRVCPLCRGDICRSDATVEN